MCISDFHARPSTLNTRSLAALVAITQIVFNTISLRARNSNRYDLATTGECCCTLELQALCGIEFLAHFPFTRIGSIFSCPYKEFLLTRLPRLKFNPHLPHKCVNPQPPRINPPRPGLLYIVISPVETTRHCLKTSICAY